MKRSPFNTCDYLCKRCEETENCAIYALLKEKVLTRRSRDAVKGWHLASLEDVKESLDETMELLKNVAADLHIELDDAGGLEELDQQSIEHDALCQLALTFCVKAASFLGKTEPFIKSGEEGAFEDLVWYHRMVSVKTHRAVASDYDGLSEDAIDSAEVAVRSLTRCVEAFEEIEKSCPLVSDESRHLSGTALEIRRQLQKRFARKTG
jgi:hypothetical protein